MGETGQRYKGLENTGKGPKLVKWHELVEPVANRKVDVLTKDVLKEGILQVKRKTKQKSVCYK